MADLHSLKIATYNLHGLNQGGSMLHSLCRVKDVVFVQEHWQAPFDLNRLYNLCDDCICFATSAMDDAISKGCLYGRPFGGIAIFVKKTLGNVTKLVKASTRYIIVQIGKVLFINVYLPSVSTPNRTEVFIDCLSGILNDIGDLHYSEIVFGGDMNVDVAADNELCALLRDFARDLELRYLYDKLPSDDRVTYRVDATGAKSAIDHFAVSESMYDSVVGIKVEDSGINLSDHCPVTFDVIIPDIDKAPSNSNGSVKPCMQPVYRWDMGDLIYYYSLTRDLLSAIDAPKHLLSDCDSPGSNVLEQINQYYNSIVCCLREASHASIPRKKHSHFKYWWDEELTLLKQQAIRSFKLWSSAGKPRHGVLFDSMRHEKAIYKLAIRNKEKSHANEFSDSLNDALIGKDLNRFWQSWRSKFGSKSTATVIDGLNDGKAIADRFASIFQDACVPNSLQRHRELETQFSTRYSQYVGDDFNDNSVTVELVSECIDKLKKGKAPGLDDLTSEHISLAHPIVAVHLSLLFKMILKHSIVPDSFGHGIVIPLVKNTDGNRFVTDNYRGITISPVISKMFESLLMLLFKDKLTSDSLQFGFKQNSSCNHALFTLRNVVQHYVADNSTVNICALDISKAFDRVDHFALLQCLMDRNVPRTFIDVLQNWLAKSYVCVRWCGTLSFWYQITAGVRQGGILSPVLFAVYMDTLIVRLRSSGFGCKLADIYYGCLVYADDIMLLSHTANAMRCMLAICDQFAAEFDLKFNNTKSVAMRIGKRYSVQCAPFSLSGGELKCVNELKYLGVYLVAAKCFKTSLNHLKVKFYRVFNCIYSRSKAANSEMVTVQLLKAFCLPVLLYASESILLSNSQLHDLNNCLNRSVYKIFGVAGAEAVKDVRHFIALDDVAELVEKRTVTFVDRLIDCGSYVNLFLSQLSVSQ